MHSNTTTASILYGYTPPKSSPPSSPSKMKRTKSKPEGLNEKGDELNTAFYCVSPEKCNCFGCKFCDDDDDNDWIFINEDSDGEDSDGEDDWVVLFPMD